MKSHSPNNRLSKFKVIAMLLVIFINGCDEKKSVPDKVQQEADHQAHGRVNPSNNYCDSVNNGLIEDSMKGSPHRNAMETINDIHVHMEYSSPGVKERIIWGGLVAYDKVWVAGAHHATTIQFSKPVRIAGTLVPAGIYGFFAIPGKINWIIILNSRFDQHLADEYNEKEDILRVEVSPESHPMTHRLTYEINKIDAESGSIAMLWEKLKISILFTNATQ